MEEKNSNKIKIDITTEQIEKLFFDEYCLSESVRPGKDMAKFIDNQYNGWDNNGLEDDYE